MNASALFAHLQARYGQCSAVELAALLGIEVRVAAWTAVAGRVVWLGECARHPQRITVNEIALERLTQAPVADSERQWFTRERLAEVIIAHELFHLLTPKPRIWASASELENQAHAFAQRWTGLPFHPTRYEKLLWDSFSE